MGVVAVATELLRDILLFLACTRASRAIHDEVLLRVMRGPMHFFDMNPMGRILNRCILNIFV